MSDDLPGGDDREDPNAGDGERIRHRDADGESAFETISGPGMRLIPNIYGAANRSFMLGSNTVCGHA